MSIRFEKDTGDIVFSGFEQGVSPSPHKGIGNLQNVNISTEMGEVMCSFPRTLQTRATFSGLEIDQFTTDQVILQGASFVFVVGDTINVAHGTIGGGTLTDGNYYIHTQVSTTLGSQIVKLTKTLGGAAITSMTAGTGTYSSMKWPVSGGTLGGLNVPVAKAIENYFDGTSQQYRYYFVDNKGQVWYHDTGSSWSQANWTPIDIQTSLPTGAFQWGIGVYQGYVHIFSTGAIYVKETSLLGVAWKPSNLFLSATNLTQPHFVLTGHQAAMNYTDSNFVGQIQGDSVTTANLINNWSYGQFTLSGNKITISPLFGGNFPLVGQKITFTASTSVDTAVTVDVVYYVIAENYSQGLLQFEVSDTIGGSTIVWNGDAVGTQYYNSYDPGITTAANATDTNGVSTLDFTPQACTLPSGEIAISLAEAGNVTIIGCNGNVLYPWDGTSPTASGIINIPENGAYKLLSVNNMVLIFAGNKGNIYITSGSSASPVISVPDYCAGIAGSELTYIEPYFSWGGVDYIRGRVYFSILDQTAAKTGNCGGIWSFVPTFNAFPQQDEGMALRMENTSSYATLNGYTPVIIANQNQAAIGVQYYSAWVSAYNYPTSGTSGVDTSGTAPTVAASIETDLVAIGTLLGKQKTTFSNLEYKLAAPLVAGESVAINFRGSGTDAFATAGAVKTESATGLSGYISPISFDTGQWLQLQAVLTPNGTATYSGNRLTEIRLRK